MFYHASPIGGVTVLKPEISNHNKPLVYLSRKRENVLVYLSNAVEKYCRENGFSHNGKWHKWATYGFDEQGILVLDEYYPDALEETYKGVSGFIYSADCICEVNNGINISNVAVSERPVTVASYEFIEDAYNEIIKAENSGLIKIRRYEELDDKMLSRIESVIRSEYTDAANAPDYRFFLKAKFDFLNPEKSEFPENNSEEKFTGRADEYSKGRPGYSEKFIDCLFDKYDLSGNSAIADIGSGTGKFASQLLIRGCRCYCVEINDDMRQQADKELSEFPFYHSVKGSAENTNLTDSSVDFITAAQAFHWFDVNAFKAESLRILKPGGRVFLIWNIRNTDSQINKRLHRVFSDFCPDFKGFSGGIKPHDERIRYYFDNRYERLTFDNPLYLDREKFINRSLSASYSLKNGDVHFDEYITELNNLFDEFQVNGVVLIENNTVVYTGIPD